MKSGIGRVYVLEALQKAESCFLCYLEDRFEQRYIENYLSELVMDSRERGKIIESRGFCNYHFYKMFTISTNPGSSDGHGMALILESVTEQVLDDIKSQRRAESAWSRRPRLRLRRSPCSMTVSRLLKTVAHQVKCPACDHVSRMVQAYTRDFLREIAEDKEIQKLFDTSNGLCIPHYVIASLIASRMFGERSEPIVEKIIEKQIQILDRTQTDLAEYIKRQDYHFLQKDRAGTEKTISRSLVRVAGKRGIDRILTLMLRAEKGDTSCI